MFNVIIEDWDNMDVKGVPAQLRKFQARVHHIRNKQYDSKKRKLNFLQNGGATVVFLQDVETKEVYSAASYCHVNDKFCKRIGILNAINKITRRLYPEMSIVSTSHDGPMNNTEHYISLSNLNKHDTPEMWWVAS